MIQLGSEAPVMALDGNGHLMLSDNGDLRTALLQNLRCEEETELPVAFRDLGRSELFPQSLTLTEAAPGAVSAYLAEQEAAQTDGSADTSSDAESDDSTDDTSATLIQPVNYVYIGTATISAQGAVTQWLNFLDEVEHRYKGLRVTNFSIADYDYVANNTQAVSTNLITGTLEIYMCVSDKEADA